MYYALKHTHIWLCCDLVTLPSLLSCVCCAASSGNYLRRTLLNQARSDSELATYRAHLSTSMSNIANELIYHKPHDHDSLLTSKQGIFLPMQNMKHNVTEKVAQVSTRSYRSLTVGNAFKLIWIKIKEQ